MYKEEKREQTKEGNRGWKVISRTQSVYVSLHTRGFLRELLQRPSSSLLWAKSKSSQRHYPRRNLENRDILKFTNDYIIQGKRGTRDTMRFPYSTSRNVRSREGENGRDLTPGVPSFPRIGLRLVSLAENTRITPGPGLYEDMKPAVGRISRTLRGRKSPSFR